VRYLIVLSMFFFFAAASQAQDSSVVKRDLKQKQHFVDKNGDGYNDNAPDHDGDGIPDGLDPDWQKLKKQKGQNKTQLFIDLDGDGINDYLETSVGKGKKNKKGEIFGRDRGTPMNPTNRMGKQKRQGKHGGKH